MAHRRSVDSRLTIAEMMKILAAVAFAFIWPPLFFFVMLYLLWPLGVLGRSLSMRDRDWFILGCRLFGVWVVYMGITYLVSYIDARIGYVDAMSPGSKPSGILIYAFTDLGFGFYLLFGTRHLAGLCYESEDAKSREQAVPDLVDRDSA